MRRPVLLGVVVMALYGWVASCGGDSSIGGPDTRSLRLQDCLLKGASGWNDLEAQCGSWQVLEDRESTQSRKISLNLAVVPAVTRSPDPFPIFILVGGPGQAATESYGALQEAFGKLHKTHDIVLLDQRGTGTSSPKRCPGDEGEMLLPGMADEDLQKLIQECLSELEGDLTQYNTAESVDDLEEIREVLGYEKVNLYGVSYGTRLAQEFIRKYPERVRSVVLDGVVPPSLALGTNVARSAQRALDLIFARCAADPSCAESYPHLPTQFAEVLERLREQPRSLSIPHPRTAAVKGFTLTYELAAISIRLLSYSPETVALLPLIIDSAWKEDWSPLAAQYLIVADRLAQTIADAMNFSVVCSEDVPFFDSEEIAAANQGTYLGDVQVSMIEKICRIWPVAPVPEKSREPLEIDVPALLLSGEADPITPPAYGEEVASKLPNALHLIVPGMGHNVVNRGCVPDIMTQFMTEGSLADLETTCVGQVQPSPFFRSFVGPEP